MKQIIYSIFVIQILTKETVPVQNTNTNHKFDIGFDIDKSIQKTQLCTPEDLILLKPIYIDYMFQHNISLLTSFQEINNKMCHKMIFKKTNYNVYLYQFHLHKTEFFQDKNQSCNIALQFKEINQEQKNQDTYTLHEDNKDIYLERIKLTLSNYVRKQKCELLLKDEEDYKFENRLRQKLDNKQFHEKIKYQMTKKIELEPETFASTVLVSNDQLKEALTKEAYVKVLYEQFDCFPMRLNPFKNLIEDKEEQIKKIVNGYLIQAQPAFQKLYEQETKEFQRNLEVQLADKLGQIAENKGAHMFLEQVSPNTSNNLTQGIAQAVVGFLFQIAFQTGMKVVGSIVNNTVGRIYRGITGFVHRRNQHKRNFEYCFKFKELNMNDILQKKVHGILNYDITQDNLQSCLAEHISINNASLGYELRMQIQSPNGLCFLNIFVNSSGIINYLQPENDELSCASFDQYEEGNQMNSVLELNPSQNFIDKINEGTNIDHLIFSAQGLNNIQNHSTNIDQYNFIQSHPIDLDQYNLIDLEEDSNQLGRIMRNNDYHLNKFRLI